MILAGEVLHSLPNISGLRLIEVRLLLKGLLIPDELVFVPLLPLQLRDELSLLSVKIVRPTPQLVHFLGAELLQATLRL